MVFFDVDNELLNVIKGIYIFHVFQEKFDMFYLFFEGSCIFTFVHLNSLQVIQNSSISLSCYTRRTFFI